MLPEALSIYRRHFGALVLTCALALVPANLIMAGAVIFGVASMGGTGVAEAKTHTRQVEEKQHDLQEKPPPTVEQRDVRVQQLGREAIEGGANFDPHPLQQALPLTYSILIAIAILLGGIALAHAALTPLVFSLQRGAAAGPAHAWGQVAPRIRAVLSASLLGALLVALGFVFLVVPGVVLAIGFAFAVPVAMSENSGGKRALERSWALTRGQWRPIFGIGVLFALFTVAASAISLAAPAGPWRALLAALVRVVLYPLPLVALVLQYQRASTSVAVPRPDSSGRGSADTALHA